MTRGHKSNFFQTISLAQRVFFGLTGANFVTFTTVYLRLLKNYWLFFKQVTASLFVQTLFIIIVLSHQLTLMVFPWSLSDSKSPQVSRTLFSILAVLKNAIVWMVSTGPPTSKSSSLYSNPLITVPKAPITIGIIVTRMFHSFF